MIPTGYILFFSFSRKWSSCTVLYTCVDSAGRSCFRVGGPPCHEVRVPVEFSAASHLSTNPTQPRPRKTDTPPLVVLVEVRRFAVFKSRQDISPPIDILTMLSFSQVRTGPEERLEAGRKSLFVSLRWRFRQSTACGAERWSTVCNVST